VADFCEKSSQSVLARLALVDSKIFVIPWELVFKATTSYVREPKVDVTCLRVMTAKSVL
jgi:hypothetical protein